MAAAGVALCQAKGFFQEDNSELPAEKTSTFSAPKASRPP